MTVFAAFAAAIIVAAYGGPTWAWLGLCFLAVIEAAYTGKP